jgi:hypothetical protein
MPKNHWTLDKSDRKFRNFMDSCISQLEMKLTDFGIPLVISFVSPRATVPYSPDMNAYAERSVGSARRECLDRLLSFTEKHLRNVVKEYVKYYNLHRPHQGIGNVIPAGVPPNGVGEIKVRSQLFGLVNEYYREAA